MSQSTSIIRKSSFQRKHPAGFLENRGVKYYQYLAKKAGITDAEALVAIDDLPSDDSLCSTANSLTHFAAFIAFGIGALTTIVSVWFEWEYAGRLDNLLYYSCYLLLITAMLGLEMTVLFWLGLRTVHQLACLTGPHNSHDDPFLTDAYTVPNMLARAALEVPDPVIHYLGIDPLKHVPKSRLLFIGLLYKAKVLLSSLFIKFICVRIFGKGGSRLGFAWVAIPVTGIWDAVVMYKVAKEARLRLFGNRLARHIADEMMQPEFISQLSAKAKEGAIRAVATMMVLSQNHHPNMLVLLITLCKNFEIDDRCEYDNWADFLTLLDEVNVRERYFILDLLSVSAAFDGHLSRLERHHLPQAFGEQTEIYMLRIEALKQALLNGRLHKAKQLCMLDFEPG